MNEKEIELKQRISEKIEELVNCLEEFRKIDIPEFEEYQKDLQLKAACERYFERIVELIIPISLLLVRLKKLDQPENEDHIFRILSKNNLISSEFAKRLKDAKDMRNIVIHNYLKVDDHIVYQAITEEIIQDAEEFIENINRILD